MWVGVHILSHMTGKKEKKHVFKNDKALHIIQLSFLVPRQAMKYKQMQDTKWGSTPVYCFFTILHKLVISKVGHFSCQLKECNFVTLIEQDCLNFDF